MVLRQREIRDADEEHVCAFELEVAKIKRSVARVVEHADFNGMHARGKDLLCGEIALRVDRNLAAGHPYRVSCGYAAALNLHRAAAERNPVACQVVPAVGGQQFIRRSFQVCRRCLAAVQPQRPRPCFVEVSFRIVSSQQVLEFACRA